MIMTSLVMERGQSTITHKLWPARRTVTSASGPSKMIAGSGKMMRKPKFFTIEELAA